MGSDFIIHDCTFDNSKKDKAKEYGHSTAKQAAQLAEKAKTSNLALTHISPIYDGSEEVLSREAKEKYHGNVFIASDFMRFEVASKT
jgi:ribonuclease Z